MMRRAFLVFVSLVLVHFAWAGSYDPLVVDPKFHPKIRDLTVRDAARNRDIPVRIYFPHKHEPAPVVLFSHNAEHSVFIDRALPGDGERRNPNHHRVILALSTGFWDAYLQDNKDALAWLNGTGPRSVMEPADDWKALPEKWAT